MDIDPSADFSKQGRENHRLGIIPLGHRHAGRVEGLRTRMSFTTILAGGRLRRHRNSKKYGDTNVGKHAAPGYSVSCAHYRR
jgi:hypothetical protein